MTSRFITAVLALVRRQAWAMGLAFTALGLVLAIYRSSLYAGYSAINGTFQILNPVNRMAHGQAPYGDFTNYLGLGPILMVRLFRTNATVSGVILGRNLACAASILLIFGTFAVLTEQKKLRYAVLLFLGLNTAF